MPQPLTLPVAEWAPDMPAFNTPGCGNVRNVIPRTPASYGPLSGLSVYSSALANRCQGAASFLDGGGNVTIFAGDAHDLYALNSAGAAWTTVSKTALHPYATPSDGSWAFALVGSRVVAGNFNDPMQSYVLGSSTQFADLAAAAPRCRYLAVVRNFLVGANTSDPVGGAQPQRVWWSALNDPTNWPTPGTAAAAQVQSDYNDLLGAGGWIQGIVGNLGTADGAVFMERAVWRMVYAGPPAVFYFFSAEGARGTPAPGSIVQLGPVVYYLGRDGFYAFDGTTSRPIGVNKIDKYFYSNVDQNNLQRVVGTVDPINKLIIWAWPDGTAVNGNPNHLLLYNWQLDRWSIADVTVETLTAALSFGTTLDQMNVYGTLDAMPQFPLDSRLWTGGKDLLAAFDASHRLNYFSGPSLAATVDTAEVQPFPGRRALAKAARPLVDGGVPSVALGTRDRLVDAVAFNAPAAMTALGTCPQRASGRYLRGEITVPAGASWTHIQGLELQVTPAGVR
jgi:hypothetical protein